MQDLSPGSTLLILREEELRQGLELIYLAQRDIETAAEPILAEHQLSVGQFRVIRLIRERQPIAVGELADALRLTKQSLGRLIDTLIARGLIVQKPGQSDRRQRIVVLTEAGGAIERALWEAQRPHIARAYRDSGPKAVEAFRTLLGFILDQPEDRRRFERSDPAQARD